MTRPATVTELDEGAKAAADAAPTIEKSHPNLAAALVAALKDLTVIEKGRTANVGTYSYSYTALDDIVRITRPKLAAHGIVVVQFLGHHGTDPAVTTVLIHESGETLSSEPLPFPRGKDAQATGSFVTYMRRYSLLAALGLATGEDDDGAAAQPAIPWTKADAMNRLFAAVKDDEATADANKKTARQAWEHFGGETKWREWEHAFPTAEVEAWVHEEVPADADA